MSADALLARLPRTILVVGKGGVGKTTCAAALATRSAERSSTLVLSTDPARALPTVLGAAIGSSPTRLGAAGNLEAQLLDADALRSRFLDRWGDVLRTILDRGTYLDDSDIAPLVDTALPGGDEIFSALALAELFVGDRYDRIVVDTAPTGHTLRMLQLPRTFRALVKLFDAMQSKHRFMVRTLTRTYRPDAADAFLRDMTTLSSALDGTLRDQSRCAAVLVTNEQPLVIAESRRYVVALRELGMHVATVVWNAVADLPDDPDAALGVTDVEHFAIPILDEFPIGVQALQLWVSAMRPFRDARGEGRRVTRTQEPRAGRRVSDDRLATALRPLTIVAGKGGVGKTTVACALATRAAQNGETLVVSTDPAPSLADAFAQPIPDADTPVRGIENLFARQMDASAAFGRLKSEYEARVDALFDALVGKGVDLAHDYAITRDLLSLAPPGIDEVYALSLLADALEGRYRTVIVDPAPTGHLLRLLQMPQLALSWSHQLMRLMLKYKDVTGLGDTARDLLDFARQLRALDATLRDAQRSAVVLVMLDEPVVRDESERLAAAVRALDVHVSAIVQNRANPARRGLPVPDAPVHFEAPATEPAPSGVDALRAWLQTWTEPAR